MQYTKETAKNVASNSIGLKNQNLSQKVIDKMAMEHREEISDNNHYRTFLAVLRENMKMSIQS